MEDAGICFVLFYYESRKPGLNTSISKIQNQIQIEIQKSKCQCFCLTVNF